MALVETLGAAVAALMSALQRHRLHVLPADWALGTPPVILQLFLQLAHAPGRVAAVAATAAVAAVAVAVAAAAVSCDVVFLLNLDIRISAARLGENDSFMLKNPLDEWFRQNFKFLTILQIFSFCID